MLLMDKQEGMNRLILNILALEQVLGAYIPHNLTGVIKLMDLMSIVQVDQLVDKIIS